MACGMRTAKDGSRYFMPDCIGGAHSEAYCTCHTSAERKRAAREREDRLEKVEAELTALKKRLNM